MELKKEKNNNNDKNIFQIANKFFEDFKQKWKDYLTIDFFDSMNLLLFLLGSCFLAYFFFQEANYNTEYVTAEILFVTFIAILQYTKETFWLKCVNQKLLDSQRDEVELSMMPVISMTDPEIENNKFKIRIKNIGIGIAKHIN